MDKRTSIKAKTEDLSKTHDNTKSYKMKKSLINKKTKSMPGSTIEKISKKVFICL